MRRARTLRQATFEIAHAVVESGTLDQLFERIHGAVGGLLEARNFYVALHDPETGELSFPYFRDEVDPAPGRRLLGRGLTEYVLRSGLPLLADDEVFAELSRRGEVEPIGPDSVDWLGVPLRAGARVIGVLAVQSYSGAVRYRTEDLEVLDFVSTQVALAIERRRSEEALWTSFRSLIQRCSRTTSRCRSSSSRSPRRSARWRRPRRRR